LIKNGLTSRTFGESEIKGLNITVTGFCGAGAWENSHAMTAECG